MSAVDPCSVLKHGLSGTCLQAHRPRWSGSIDDTLSIDAWFNDAVVRSRPLSAARLSVADPLPLVFQSSSPSVFPSFPLDFSSDTPLRDYVPALQGRRLIRLLAVFNRAWLSIAVFHAARSQSGRDNSCLSLTSFSVLWSYDVALNGRRYLLSVSDEITNSISVLTAQTVALCRQALSTAGWRSCSLRWIIHPRVLPADRPLPLVGHIWDVMLVWRKGNINKNCLCVTVLCTIIMVHKDMSSSYRSVDCILCIL